MFDNRPTTAQIDKKYRNVADEGIGTYKHYRQNSRKLTRRLFYAFGAIIGIVALMILMFALKDNHTYLQQLEIIAKYIFGFTPGRINNKDAAH